MLFLCQHGYEELLARELGDAGLTVTECHPGWARAEPLVGDAVTRSLDELCFPHLTLVAPEEVRADSVNALAQRIADGFMAGLCGERVEAAWPCVFQGAAEVPGLGRRVAGVEKVFHELLRKKLGRVAKLAAPGLPRGTGAARGLYVFMADFGRAFLARELWRGGQRRMADDELAPSRSYLKIEEAYGVLGREPTAGETVCDLGAAPGGWSYSAAKRGARVVAVDNGPLKGGALNHPLIEHRREDAFRFGPAGDDGLSGGRGVVAPYDWLFCDLVEDPHHVLHNLVEPWLVRGRCRRFVAILKFGRADPIALLRELRRTDGGLRRAAPRTRIRHLYHDREEFTLTGEVFPV